jgi:hypothetical protein
MKRWLPLALALLCGWSARDFVARADAKRVFELRTYTAAEGKLPELEARFRNHTLKLFEKHGMTNIGYWIPADGPRRADTLIYVLAHKDQDAAKKSWDAFRTDPEWLKARTASEVNGKLATKVESVYLEPRDYSAMR